MTPEMNLIVAHEIVALEGQIQLNIEELGEHDRVTLATRMGNSGVAGLRNLEARVRVMEWVDDLIYACRPGAKIEPLLMELRSCLHRLRLAHRDY